MGEGIETLRKKRGNQKVTFDNICDHLTDYSDRHPENATAMEDFARFVANVEDIEHDHEAHGRRGIGTTQDAPH